MKPGDLVAWTLWAEGWSYGPQAGTYAGTVVRVIAEPWGSSRDKIEILAEKTFIVGRRFIEVISGA